MEPAEQQEIEKEGVDYLVKLYEDEGAGSVVVDALGDEMVHEFDDFEKARDFFHSLDSQVIGHFAPVFRVEIFPDTPDEMSVGCQTEVDATQQARKVAKSYFSTSTSIDEEYENWKAEDFMSDAS